MPDKKDYSYQFYSTTQNAWDAMYEAILAAKKSIYWEIYIFIDDAVGTKFIQALAAKAKAGVDVKIIIDAVGSSKFSSAAEKYFKNTGVELLWFNRLYPSFKLLSWYWRIASRNHRKVLIVDEEVAFLGGVNVNKEYQHWHDLYVKIQGKVIRPLLRGFAKSYISSGGDKSKVKSLLHPKRAQWYAYREKIQFLLRSSRYQSESRGKKMYIRALAMANETVNLVTPYFIPDKRFFRAITSARARGVKINLYLPLRPDNKAMELLGRLYYRLAQKAGANVFFMSTMNHSKGLSVDSSFGMVGSSNMSRRSHWLDAEANVAFTDENMVKDLNAIFNEWQMASVPYDKVQFQDLGPLERFQQWVLSKVENYF